MDVENSENSFRTKTPAKIKTPRSSSKKCISELWSEPGIDSDANATEDIHESLVLPPSHSKLKRNSILKPKNVGNSDKPEPVAVDDTLEPELESMDDTEEPRPENMDNSYKTDEENNPMKDPSCISEKCEVVNPQNSNDPIKKASETSTKTPASQVDSKNKNRAEIFTAYQGAVTSLQKLKSSLNQHKAKTFFKPDLAFIRGMSTTIQQIELGLNKMGQLFSSSQSNETLEKINNSCIIAITPPASEAGKDTGLDESNNDSIGSTSMTSAVNGTSTSEIPDSSAEGRTTDPKSATSSAAVKVETETGTKQRRGKKRKLDFNVVADVVKAVKQPRRSLLSEFLEKKDKKEVVKESRPEEKDEKATPEEFEVEKILDYNRVKGKCLYQVRWRGYGANDDTWEPLDNLTGCEELLHTFVRTRLVERSKVTDPEELKELLLPVEEGMQQVLRGAFFAQMSRPLQKDVEAALPLLLANKVRVKEMHELEEDVDRIVAIKDCLSNRYQKLFSDLKQQLVLRECHQQRERQKAELRRWEREMSRICSAPAPLSVVNDVDLSLPPKDFVYINDYVAGKGISIPQDPMVGCECTDCSNSQNTCCAKQMSSFFAYSKSGRLKVSLGTAIYECNKLCACAATGTCHNRVVQRGRTVQLTIFRTANNRGWGVKAGEMIKSGSFVTEYVGEVISSEEAERRGQIYDARGCTYLFDLDYNKGDLNPYTVDAAKYGNVSHFINHSCDPNLVVFNVWVNCLDPDLPKLALFATRDIKKGEEITFDYNSSARPQENLPVIPEDESGGPALDVLSPHRSPSQRSTNAGSLELSVCKTPKRGIANGKTRCNCGAANCRKFFF